MDLDNLYEQIYKHVEGNDGTLFDGDEIEIRISKDGRTFEYGRVCDSGLPLIHKGLKLSIVNKVRDKKVSTDLWKAEYDKINRI